MEKIWTWDNLITKYITEKARRGYEASCTPEEIIGFLNFISCFVTISTPDIGYNEALQNYLDGFGSKCWEWSIRNEDFVYHPVVEQLESGLIVPTYSLISEMPTYGDFDSDKKAYDETLSDYLAKYLKRNCSKRKIITSKSVDDDTIQFGEKVAATLLIDIWNDKVGRYIENGRWPTQCNDIKKYLLDRDLASTIELPAMRDELIDFYFTISGRIINISQNDPNFRMTNFEDEVLAKSNFDLVMEGYCNTFHCRTVNKHQEGVIIDRKQNEFQTVIDWYKGNIKKDSLASPKVLTLVRELKSAKKK